MSADSCVRGEAFRGVAVALAGLLVVGAPPMTVRAAEPGAATASVALTVASEPSGATVFVDGQYQGATPVAVSPLSAGDHRVKVVKNGYLENSRLVSLASGKPGSVRVHLTPRPALQVEPETERAGGGGGSTKWLLIGLGVVAAGAVVFQATRNGNDPPVAGNIGVAPSGPGLAGATRFSFTAQGASDPNGDRLTYDWQFGDGSSGSGASVTKVFDRAGTFAISLTVSDGKATVSAPGVTVDVRSLSGAWGVTWIDRLGSGTLTYQFDQNGSSLNATCSNGNRLSGTVADPRNLNVTHYWVSCPDQPQPCSVALDSSLGTFTCQIQGCDNWSPYTLVFRRQ